MSVIDVSEHTARWLLKDAERNPGVAFEMFPPHYCKLCTDPTPPAEQKRHLTGHRRELERLTAGRRSENTKRLKQANRLRRETSRA